MAEKLFPERQRCKNCSKKLETTVINGLYDSYKCAKLAEPFQDIAKAPRECKTQRDNQWHWKRRYRSESEIPSKLRAETSSSWYWCNHCGNLHIGHSRIDLTKESHRVIRDRKELAETLIKLRGKATVKEISTISGVKQIRIKELEDPNSSPNLDSLFQLLAFYKTKLSIVFKS